MLHKMERLNFNSHPSWILEERKLLITTTQTAEIKSGAFISIFFKSVILLVLKYELPCNLLSYFLKNEL